MTSPTELLDASVAAWHESIDAFCRLQDVGFVERGAHGTKAFYSGAPVSVLNAVVSMTRRPDVDEIRLLSDAFSTCAVPWSIQTRDSNTHADEIARHILGKEAGQFATRDRLEIGYAHQDQRL